MTEYQDMGHEEEAGASLFSPAKIIGMMRRYYLLLAVVVFSISLVSIFVAYSLPVKYQATTRILIDSREKNIVDMVDVLSGIEANTPSIESEVEIIKSRGIAVDVINHMDFAHDPEFSGSPGLISRVKTAARKVMSRLTGRKFSNSGMVDAGTSGELVDAYFSRLGVRRVRNTYLIEISFEAGTPLKATGIVNTVADFYLRHQLNAKTKAAGLATTWLERRINELRTKVVQGERKIEEFKIKHRMFDTEGHLLNEKQMARAMEQTVMARSKTFEARSKYLQIRKLLDSDGSKSTVADVLKSPTIAMLKGQLAKVTRKRAELSTRYGARHPEIRKIAAELGDIRRQLGSEVDRIVANLKNEFDEAEALESGLKSSLGGLQVESAQSRKSSVKLREMQREVKASRLVYEKFLERYKQTAEQENMQLPDARIVESAMPPGFPSSPKRKRIIAMGLGGGFALAFLLMFGVEFIRGGISDPDELKSVLGIRHVAPLPLIDLTEARLTDSVQLMRNVVNDPQSVFSDSIREMRFMLDSGNFTSGSRIIMVASALPGEGKSVIASNLAHHFSAVGMRTVLVDGDLRQNSLTRTLLPHTQYGMFECLRDNQPIDVAIVMDRSSGLFFLPAKGPEPLNVSAVDVLGSGRMQNALDALRDDFDVVIMDCPPVDPVIDARILAEHSDQLVFVCKWRDTRPAMASKALGNLKTSHQKFTIAALNKMDAGEFGSKYGYGNIALSNDLLPQIGVQTA